MVIPDPVAGFVQFVIAYLVTNGLKSLSQMLHRDISGWAAVVTLALVQLVLVSVNAIVVYLPSDKQAGATKVLEFLALVLGAMGFHYTVKQMNTPKVVAVMSTSGTTLVDRVAQQK